MTKYASDGQTAVLDEEVDLEAAVPLAAADPDVPPLGYDLAGLDEASRRRIDLVFDVLLRKARELADAAVRN